MKNLRELPKEIQNIIISAYEIGYNDRECKLAPFNAQILDAEPIEYLDAVINVEQEKEECLLSLIDSVS